MGSSSAGEVNVSLSGVLRYAPKSPKLIKNEVVVQLMDSFHNPVLSEQSRLKLEIASVNNSGFSIGMFVDNNDGTYTVNYLAKDVGTYEMCASFDGNRFLPCPFGVNIYSSKRNSSTELILTVNSIYPLNVHTRMQTHKYYGLCSSGIWGI